MYTKVKLALWDKYSELGSNVMVVFQAFICMNIFNYLPLLNCKKY